MYEHQKKNRCKKNIIVETSNQINPEQLNNIFDNIDLTDDIKEKIKNNINNKIINNNFINRYTKAYISL